VTDLCAGRVAIVTGAGRGIGRGEALGLAREGAKVVVADIGTELDGTGSSASVAESVVNEIKALGGDAIAANEDVGDWEASKRIIDLAIETFGGLDIIVNNAGNLRDRMMFNMSEEDFDLVIRVHLKGTFNLTRWASLYWRGRTQNELTNSASIVNTTSPAGLYGSAGQQNYSAAKAGIAIQTIGAARELARYGVRVNAISPGARTRMTDTLRPGGTSAEPAPDQFDAGDPENIAPLVVWLASNESADVTGQVFEVRGGSISVAEGWRRGPSTEKESRWDPSELTAIIPKLVAEAYQVPAPGGGRRPPAAPAS
jgi:NAD(P)-dependent dehydrogenase (short-subunit alcohol dehydrogenase family)